MVKKPCSFISQKCLRFSLSLIPLRARYTSISSWEGFGHSFERRSEYLYLVPLTISGVLSLHCISSLVCSVIQIDGNLREKTRRIGWREIVSPWKPLRIPQLRDTLLSCTVSHSARGFYFQLRVCHLSLEPQEKRLKRREEKREPWRTLWRSMPS